MKFPFGQADGKLGLGHSWLFFPFLNNLMRIQRPNWYSEDGEGCLLVVHCHHGYPQLSRTVCSPEVLGQLVNCPCTEHRNVFQDCPSIPGIHVSPQGSAISPELYLGQNSWVVEVTACLSVFAKQLSTLGILSLPFPFLLFRNIQYNSFCEFRCLQKTGWANDYKQICSQQQNVHWTSGNERGNVERKMLN